MKQFGLIGFPLTHSFSKGYFSEKFLREHISDCSYENFPIESVKRIRNILESNRQLKGLNVTIPYKEQVIPFLHSVDEAALKVGAVNTIKVMDAGGVVHLKGFNTDVYGFTESLKEYLIRPVTAALILGTGGASKAVAYALKTMGIGHRLVSRKQGYVNYEKLDKSLISGVQLIVNTTPLGMYPDVDSAPPIPYNFLTSEHILYDLVYNPEETLFLTKGKERGALCINGLRMLHLQAEKAWEIWNTP